jgi:hypothetical protein
MIVVTGQYKNWPAVVIRDNGIKLKHVQATIKGCRDEVEMHRALRGVDISFDILPGSCIGLYPGYSILPELSEANVRLIGRKRRRTNE